MVHPYCDQNDYATSQVDESYAYLGWLPIDTEIYNVPAGIAGVDDIDDLITDGIITGSEMLSQGVLETLGSILALDPTAAFIASGLTLTPNNEAALNKILESVADVDFDITGGTVFRLREGIERFLITDINNPAGSAKAQSEVFIMWDLTAVVVEGFNHVPGGSNVLYMDGHVKFVKYPGKPPVDVSMAVIVGSAI